MAITASERLGLTIWGDGTDPLRRLQLLADHVALDAQCARDDQGTFNDRPPAGIRGSFYTVVDPADADHDGLTYRDDGVDWRIVNPFTAPDLSGYVTDAELAVALEDYLPLHGKADDADKLDGHDSLYFLPAAAQAVDSDKLDGLDSTAFARVTVDINSPRRYGPAFLLMGA